MDGNQELPPKLVTLPDQNSSRLTPEGIHPVGNTEGNPIYVGGIPNTSPKISRRGFLGFLGAAAGLLGLAWLNRDSSNPPAQPAQPTSNETLKNSMTKVNHTTPDEKGRLEAQLPNSQVSHSQPYTAGTTDLGNFPPQK